MQGKREVVDMAKEKIKRIYNTIFKDFPYFIHRMKRVIFLQDDRSTIESAKLKSDLGIKWNEHEKKVMNKVLMATMTKGEK
jgi:hypothetical protein